MQNSPPPPPGPPSGKTRIGHLSKRGDPYVRTLLMHGARSVLNHMKQKPHWLEQLLLRRPFSNQDRLGEIRRVDYHQLRSQRHDRDDGKRKPEPNSTRHHFLLVSEPM